MNCTGCILENWQKGIVHAACVGCHIKEIEDNSRNQKTMTIPKCPKCGSDWVSDRDCIVVEKHKHWYSPEIVRLSYHQIYPDKPPHRCAICGTEFGEWK